MSDPSNLEHLDEVVSAYVDGEATPEEVRLVEADPALVEQARLLRELVAMDQVEVVPEPDMKRRHLTAAMAAFEAPAEVGAEPVVDLRAEPEPAPVVDLATRRRGPAGLPRWLSAVAGTLVVVGGIGFVATQNTSEDSAATEAADSAEEAFPSRPDTTEADDGARDAAGSAVAESDDAMDDGEAMEEEAAMEDDEAMEDEAMEDEAMEDEAMEDEALADSEVVQDDEAATGEADADEDTDPAGDTPPQPQVSVTSDVTQDELLALVPGVAVLPVEAATCFDAFTASKTEIEARIGPIDAAGQTAEFFGVLIDGEPNEFVVITSAEGDRSGVLFDAACTIVDP